MGKCQWGSVGGGNNIVSTVQLTECTKKVPQVVFTSLNAECSVVENVAFDDETDSTDYD